MTTRRHYDMERKTHNEEKNRKHFVFQGPRARPDFDIKNERAGPNFSFRNSLEIKRTDKPSFRL